MVPCSVKAFSISKNTAAVDILLLNLSVTWSVSLIHCDVLWRSRKPNWQPLCRFFSSMCLKTVFSIAFSNSLLVLDKRLIERKFLGNLGSLPGFGKVITIASFQEFGKCESRRQWLIKWVKCTNDLPGRCLRHSLGMLSIPQAFLSFSEFISFCKSQGLTLSGGLLSTDSSRAWTLASTRHSWL
jgi:hypothetical protein